MALIVGKLAALLTLEGAQDFERGTAKAKTAMTDLGKETEKTASRVTKSAKDMGDEAGRSADKTASSAGKAKAATAQVGTESEKTAKKVSHASSTIGTAVEGASKKTQSSSKKASESVEGLGKQTQETANKTEQSAGRIAAAFKKIEDNSAELSTLTNDAGKLGLALTAAAAAAVTVHTSFDQAMSGVKATGSEARESINELRQAAIDAGADTAFSARESANAIEELSKAGVSASDVLSGALAGSLDLAAAGELGVAEAAGIASIAMTQFKLTGRDVGHVADLLAAGAGKAMGDVKDLGQALQQGGLVASAMGMSLEETVAALSAFASVGLLGSDAGTSMKTMLQSLQNPSSKAKKLMDELGLSLYDAQGNFAGLTNLVGQLESGMGSMTQAQRDAAMAVIFGSDAVRAANALYDQGVDGIQYWIDAVNDQGYAAEVARTRLDNLAGDLEGLGGSFETLLISMGEGADGPLRSLVQGIDAVVDSANDLPDPLKQAALLLTGAGGLTALGIAGLGKLVIGFNDTRKALNALNISGKAVGVTFGVIGATLTVATAGVMHWATKQAEAKQQVESFADSLDRATGAITNQTRELAVQALQAERGFFHNRAGRTALDEAEKMGIALDLVTDAALGNADAMEEAERQISEYLKNFQGDRLEWEEAQQAAAHLRDVIEDQAGSLDEAKQRQQAMNDALGEGARASDEVAAASQSVAEAYELQAEAAEDLWKAQLSLVDGVLSLRDAERQLEQTFDDARDKAKQASEDFSEAELKRGDALDITTDKGRANQAQLDQIVISTWALLDSMRAQGASEGELQSAMERSRKVFLGVAKQMGLNKDEARALADELNLIPAEVPTTLSVDDRMSSVLDGVIYKINSINGRTITTNIVTREQTVSSGKGNAIARASGGAIHGPGTGTSDDVLMWGSNGEHVVTAREVQAMGGHMGVERWRRAALSGDLPAFASGGAVTVADRAVATAKKRVTRQKTVVKDARKDVKSAQKRYDAIDSTKDNRTKKKAAKRRLDAEKKQLKTEEKELADLRKDHDEQKARRARLKADSREVTVDSRRGEIADRVTGGLSSALGVVDELFDQSRNTDLTKKRREAAGKAAKRLEKDLTQAYGKAEELDTQLKTAESRLQTLANIQAGVKSVLGGEFKLADSIKAATEDVETLVQKTNKAGDVWHEKVITPGTKASVTAKDILANAQAKATAFKTFTGKLDRLAALGISGVILAEIANEGLEGGTLLADALLADPATAKKLNGAYNEIDKWTTAAGASATKNTIKGYDGGVTQAQAEVDKIETSIKKVNDTIEKLATSADNAILSALGLKKDKNGKIVAKAKGGAIEGPGTGTSDDVLMWGSNGEHVWTAREVQAAGGHGNVAQLRRQALLNDLPQFKDGGQVNRLPALTTPNMQPYAMPAPAPHISVSVPDIYVQNPWTGEYMKAEMASVADKQIKVAVSTARKGY